MFAMVRRLAFLLVALFALGSCGRTENPNRHWSLERAFSALRPFAWLEDPYRHGGLEILLDARTDGMEAAARDEALGRTVVILSERVDDLGIRGAEIRRTAEGRILVRLPIDGRKGDAASRTQRAMMLIGRTGAFEFKLVRTPQETKAVFDRLDAHLAARGAGASAGMDAAQQQMPLSAHFLALDYSAFVRNEDLPSVQELLATAGVDSVVASDSQLLWGQPDAIRDLVTGRALYVVKRAPELAGGAVASAEARTGLVYADPGAWGVTVKMTPEGRAKFARVTADNVGRQLAIVLDDVVTSAPMIRERIPSGEATITGAFDARSANDLAIVLRAGALPARLEVLRATAIPPK